MVAQPSGNSWCYAEDGIVIGSSLLARDSETHCIPVMNLSDAPRALHPGARIGDVYPVTSLKQAETATVLDWPTPRTVKDVRAFLGLASYYRRYYRAPTLPLWQHL